MEERKGLGGSHDVCGPLPTSHALETSDETLTPEEGGEGVGNEEGSLGRGDPAPTALFSSGRVVSGCVCMGGGVFLLGEGSRERVLLQNAEPSFCSSSPRIEEWG